jgi:hypothetical protein
MRFLRGAFHDECEARCVHRPKVTVSIRVASQLSISCESPLALPKRGERGAELFAHRARAAEDPAAPHCLGQNVLILR